MCWIDFCADLRLGGARLPEIDFPFGGGGGMDRFI